MLPQMPLIIFGHFLLSGYISVTERKGKFKSIALLIALSGCTTIAGRDLPIVSAPNSVAKKQPLVIEFVGPSISEQNKQAWTKAFEDSNIFSSVVRSDSPKNLNPDNPRSVDDNAPAHAIDEAHSLKFFVTYRSEGYFHPYCLLTLTIIPCTPPIHWTLTVDAARPNDASRATYSTKEDAFEITWLLGFLLSGAGKSNVKYQELRQNMVNHILMKMRADNVL